MTLDESSRTPIALISVTDKTGIVEFAQDLADLGFTILSTGGTAGVLRDAGIGVVDVAHHTNSDEILDGRVKTLHPIIHGGILMDRGNPEHVKTALKNGIAPIDLVVVNLYDFEKEAKNKELSLIDAINFIDIGGPTMLRAAAKNCENCAPVIDPSDYQKVVKELRVEGRLSFDARAILAGKAFRSVSQYDNMIASYFEKDYGAKRAVEKPLVMLPVKKLRYGENPHQEAAFFTYEGAGDGLQNARVLQGKELSYNNYLDLDAATALVRDLSAYQAVAIIKHTNPCGVAASAKSEPLVDVYLRALAADSRSAFGGIVAVNQEIDAETAEKMSELFLECIAAPSYSDQAKLVFGKKKNLRLLEVPFLRESKPVQQSLLRSIQGGILQQSVDNALPSADSWTVCTKVQPDSRLLNDLVFAQIVCKHVKSNAIVYVKGLSTTAVGAGQMSRVDSATYAAEKVKSFGNSVSGCVMASDAFFPFRDTVDLAANLGVVGVIQPGGSMRDQESIDAADEHGMAMVMTGIRHFRH